MTDPVTHAACDESGSLSHSLVSDMHLTLTSPSVQTYNIH